MSQVDVSFRLKAGSYKNFQTGEQLEPGDILSTEKDMIALEGDDRWELIKEGGQETLEGLKARIRILEGQQEPNPLTEEDDLDKKTIKQLRTLAGEMEIDLSTCSGKEEILSAIRSAIDSA